MSNNTFNYFDALHNSQTTQYISNLNEKYTNLVGQPILVYKLDKIETPIDSLYNESSFSRIYLPPFEIKALHLLNPYTQNLGSSYLYSEPDTGDIQFVVNFQDMIVKIRDLKSAHTSDLNISYNGSGIAFVENNNNIFSLWLNCQKVAEFNLEDNNYNTIQKLTNKIKQISGFSATYSGKNDASINLVPFSKTKLKNKILNIYSPNLTYKNCTDIIEKGDILIDSSARVYQVNENLFSNSSMWSYQTMVLECSKAKIDFTNLPGNYIKQIQERQFGLKKVKKE